MKAGEPFERAAWSIFDELYKLDNVPGLRVQHNVSLQGLSTKHQIDVLVEFNAGGIPHQVIIQAKDWQKPVDQGEILKFHGVLSDLPGQPRGIMVARGGFQEGARQFAQARGIHVYELREPKSGESPTQQIVWHLTVFIPRWENLTPVFDNDWGRREAKAAGLSGKVHINAKSGPPGELSLTDEAGKKHGTLGDAIKQLFPSQPQLIEKTCQSLSFEPPLFLDAEAGAPISRLKLLGIQADVWSESMKVEASVELEATTAWLLQDLVTGKPAAFDEAGRLIKLEPEKHIEGIQWSVDRSLEPPEPTAS